MVAPRVFISAGMPGAGKEEFLVAIADMHLEILRMGDLVREEKKQQGVDIPTGIFAHRERLRHGNDIWAVRALKKMGTNPTVIDGCRSDDELKTFRAALGGGVKVIAIHSDPVTRFRRLQLRGREDAPRDWDEFQERDEREMEWGLAKVIALADIMIVNDAALAEFHRRCREIMRELVG